MAQINVIDLLNACSQAQKEANETGKTVIIKINDYQIKEDQKNPH